MLFAEMKFGKRCGRGSQEFCFGHAKFEVATYSKGVMPDR